MRFVDRLVHFHEGFAKVEVDPRETHLFADGSGALDPLALMEMMAQGYASASGYDSLQKGEAVREGFLVGVRKFKVHGQGFCTDALRIEVRETDVMDSFFIADAAVYRGDEKLAEGSVRVWATLPTEQGEVQG
jgi:predicted hotdog family 3-hydroxylacyl-ACP dehydratase